MQPKRQHGFTIVEIIVVVAMVSILAGALAPLVVRQMTSARRDDTSTRLVRLLEALVGRRSDGLHGYVGDMGELPASLDDLITKGTQPDYIQSVYGFSVGWNGPYVTETGPSGDPLADAWGTPIDYDGATAQLRSGGPDHSLATADDLVYPTTAAQYTGLVTVNVIGIPIGTGSPVPLTCLEADVSITLSNSGVLGTQVLAGCGPFYTAAPIHTGLHAVIVTGKATYVGKSGTRVIGVYPGSNVVTITMEQ